MRVLYCTDTYPPQINGVSVVTELSVNGMLCRGWDCAVVAPRYAEPEPVPAGDALQRLAAAPVRTRIASAPLPIYPEVRIAAPAYQAIARAIRQFSPDLVHCQTEFIIGRLGQIAARRAGIPLVSSYHTDFSRYTAAYGAGWLRPAVSAYIGRFHRRSLRTYTPSESAKADLGRFGMERVEVWGRGVDDKIFTPRQRSDALRVAYGINDAFVLLHVGRLAPEKGV